MLFMWETGMAIEAWVWSRNDYSVVAFGCGVDMPELTDSFTSFIACWYMMLRSPVKCL